MEYIAYTSNSDNSINILAGSSDPDIFRKILPISSQYNVYAGEMYAVNGKTWLSADDPAYTKAKKAHDRADALAKLDADYALQKQELVNQYTDDMLHGDSEAVETDKEAMAELDTWYDEEYAKLEGVE